ncbi:DUF853 family protein [Flavobacteriales bacterium]|nr:DUF853 family protein [Flavobacteriales bacterium]
MNVNVTGGYTILRQKSGIIEAISHEQESDGMLAKGTYLTVITSDEGEPERKSILKVVGSEQHEVYSPSPLIADFELSHTDTAVSADNKCKNFIKAVRVFDLGEREDGKIDFIKPRRKASPSTLEEIKEALQVQDFKGPKVLAATVFGNRNQLLKASNSPVSIPFPEDFYWYQSQVTGATGSGKTVALKYLATEFANTDFLVEGELMKGCVVMINVKDQDFLMMDKPSQGKIPDNVQTEWDALDLAPKGHASFQVWCNGYKKDIKRELIENGVTETLIQPKTLRAMDVNPESLLGLVQDLTAQQRVALPDVFRFWQESEKNNNGNATMGDFLDYFQLRSEEYEGEYDIMNVAGDKSTVKLPGPTRASIHRKLYGVTQFFDSPIAHPVDAEETLKAGKITAVDLVDSIEFGSVLLNQILIGVLAAKNKNLERPPILFLIDEVHKFYGSDSSKDSLRILDNICRVGRSKKIGIVFASQEPSDIPKGLENVTNSKFYFKSPSHPSGAKDLASKSEVANLRPGFCVAQVHNVPSLTCMKFPLSPSGVKID